MIASSGLRTLLNAAPFIVSPELTPRHYNVSSFIAKAENIASHLDAVQVNDNALSQARLSKVVAAQFMRQAVLEPVVQTISHQDRTEQQYDLLELAALARFSSIARKAPRKGVLALAPKQVISLRISIIKSPLLCCAASGRSRHWQLKTYITGKKG